MHQVIVLPYFDNAVVELFGPPVSPAEQVALSASLTLSSAYRIANSRQVHAYSCDSQNISGRREWLDEQMGGPKAAEDIWKHGTSVALMLGRARESMTKVSVYDEISSNGDGSGDTNLRSLVYYATDPAFSIDLTQ